MFSCPNDTVTYILNDIVSISGNKHCNYKVLPLEYVVISSIDGNHMELVSSSVSCLWVRCGTTMIYTTEFLF